MVGSAAANREIRVRVGTRKSKRRQVRSAVVVTVMGLLCAASPLMFPDESLFTKVIAEVWAAGLLLGAAMWLSQSRKILGSQELVFSARGMRHLLGEQVLFEAEWSEVQEVQVTHAVKPMSLRSPTRHQVRLVLKLRDPDGFYLRHRDVERNRLMTDLAPDQHGIALLQRTEVIEPIDTALQSTAGDRHRGVHHSEAKHLDLH